MNVSVELFVHLTLVLIKKTDRLRGVCRAAGGAFTLSIYNTQCFRIKFSYR